MALFRGVPLTDLPQGHYRAGLIDPPWSFVTRSDKGKGKSPDRHYDTMNIDDLKALPVGGLFTKDATIHVWVIDSHLELALDVIRAWGFTYKTVGFYWAKTTKDGTGFPIGTGFWTRANPEHTFECAPAAIAGGQEAERNLLATRGHPKRQSASVRRLVVSPRREHSRKPEEVAERIEQLVDGPYLELFSRTDRPGWDSWGDEVGSFAISQREKARKLHPDVMELI